ncbi:Hypothetical_protein [Hexamita inflata]|uniref:Hypothetical_protein n=1 Tax=Hexamita inflata TaxID=28002 RepID=A0AA86TV82_9EUKA|nr:Hypothetical protein HINF_LOCUS17536 [Hexamita inflata]
MFYAKLYQISSPKFSTQPESQISLIPGSNFMNKSLDLSCQYGISSILDVNIQELKQDDKSVKIPKQKQFALIVQLKPINNVVVEKATVQIQDPVNKTIYFENIRLLANKPIASGQVLTTSFAVMASKDVGETALINIIVSYQSSGILHNQIISMRVYTKNIFVVSQTDMRYFSQLSVKADQNIVIDNKFIAQCTMPDEDIEFYEMYKKKNNITAPLLKIPAPESLITQSETVNKVYKRHEIPTKAIISPRQSFQLLRAQDYDIKPQNFFLKGPGLQHVKSNNILELKFQFIAPHNIQILKLAEGPLSIMDHSIVLRELNLEGLKREPSSKLITGEVNLKISCTGSGIIKMANWAIQSGNEIRGLDEVVCVDVE